MHLLSLQACGMTALSVHACPGTARASVVVLGVEGEKVLSNQAVDQHVVLPAAVGYVQVRLLARGTAWQPVRSRVTHHRHMHSNMHAHEVWSGMADLARSNSRTSES